MLDRALDIWPVRKLVLAWWWLECRNLRFRNRSEGL